MKKQWFSVGIFIVIEQFVKVLIWQFALGKRISLIPEILRFEPHLNTNLTWIASMANFVMPIFLMLIIQISLAIGMTLLYRYQRYAAVKTNIWLDLSFCFVLAGIGCSFIDVVFWGGSLDYFGLFNWFIFDIKDVFLNIGWMSMVIWFSSREYKHRKAGVKTFKHWFSTGCKLV